MVIQILAAALLVLGSALVIRAFVELDQAPPSRALRSGRRAGDEDSRDLPRAA